MKSILIFIVVIIIANSSFAITAARLLEKADQAIEQEEFEMALEYYDQAIKLAPENAKAYYLRGIANYEEVEDELAIADFDKALELGFDRIDLYYYRGLVYDSLMEEKEAVDDLTIFLNSKTAKLESELVTAYTARGYCSYELGNMTVAMADYNAIIEIDPTKIGPYNMRARIYLNNKQYDKAINEYKHIQKLFPAKDKYSRVKIIIVKNKSGDFEGAINDCSQLIKEGYSKSVIYRLRAEAFLGIKKYQLALDDVNTAIEKFAPFTNGHNLKAKAYLGLGNYDEARKEIKRALKIKPDNKDFLKTKEEIERAIKG